MKKISYNISVQRPDADYGVHDYVPVSGYHAFSQWGLDFGVHKDVLGWTVSELTSGRSIINDPKSTINKAVERAKYVLEQVGEEHTLKCVCMALQLELA